METEFEICLETQAVIKERLALLKARQESPIPIPGDRVLFADGYWAILTYPWGDGIQWSKNPSLYLNERGGISASGGHEEVIEIKDLTLTDTTAKVIAWLPKAGRLAPNSRRQFTFDTRVWLCTAKRLRPAHRSNLCVSVLSDYALQKREVVDSRSPVSSYRGQNRRYLIKEFTTPFTRFQTDDKKELLEWLDDNHLEFGSERGLFSTHMGKYEKYTYFRERPVRKVLNLRRTCPESLNEPTYGPHLTHFN